MCIARPILYCDLTLKTITPDFEPNLTVSETFSLLERDADLARSTSVRTLTLATDELEIGNTSIWVHVASLRNISQLKRLTIVGNVFRAAGEDVKADLITTLCSLPLEELSFRPPGGCFYLFSEDQFGQIANLRSIDCYSEIDEHEHFAPRCLRLLSSSATTLTSLSLCVMYIDPDWALTLFTMRFPCLRSLTLDTLDEGIHSPLGFHDFLLVHNQALEHLDLGYTSRRQVDPAALVFSADAVFEPHCLPSLRVFRGHYRNVETMAGARMQCLTGSLTKLTIGLGRVEDSKGKIDRMLDAIETAGCLSTLKELDFDFFQSQADERDWIPTFIRRWGEICGSSLEIWTGLFPFVWSWLPEELAAFFGAFSKLRVIWLANDSTVFGVFPGGEHDNGEDDDEEYVRSLARKRSSLEEVWLTWGDIASCWKLERGPGSALVVRQIGDC